jgi:hypothetical protein
LHKLKGFVIDLEIYFKNSNEIAWTFLDDEDVFSGAMAPGS